MTFLDLVIVSLATLYFSTVLANDQIVGPRNILTTIRRGFGVNWRNGFVETIPGTIGELIMCPYCNSIWVSLVVLATYLILVYYHLPVRVILSAPAAAGFVILIQELKKQA